MVRIANLNAAKLTVARDADQILSSISELEFDRIMILGDNLAALSFRTRKTHWITPTIIEAVILDQAKYQMISSHYYTMRGHVGCRLLYSDFDSLLFQIRSRDFYEQLARKSVSVVTEFDFSNYPNDQGLYSTEIKLVVLQENGQFYGRFYWRSYF